VAAIEIITAEDDSQWEEFLRLDSEGFVSPLDATRAWATPVRNHLLIRLARYDGRFVGCYSLGRVLQRFGGRSIECAPVSSVTVQPDSRGCGVGEALMRDLIGTARDRGQALAPLWAAVPRFYHRHGWGLGDRAMGFTARMNALANFRGDGEVVRDPADDEWRRLWEQVVEPWDGAFMPPVWVSITPPPEPAELRYAMGWREGGRLTGYMRFGQRRSGTLGSVETLVDRFGAITGAAHRGLFGILGGNGGQGDDVRFEPGRLPRRNALHLLLSDPHRDRLGERSGAIWMQRLTDVPAALTQRGYAEHVGGTVDIEIHDSMAEQPQRVRCTVEAGRMSVAPTASAAVRLDSRALASWYCGTVSASGALRLGLLEGEASAIALMDAIIPRREVWLGEHF